MSIFHVAIDGPAASGKGTAAAGLSKHLGIPCLDTGAINRGVAVHIRNTPSISNMQISVQIVDNITRVTLNGKDITMLLRENEISQAVSKIATNPDVRALVTKISQGIANKQSLIAEGRDICSVVLPEAKYKFFLTANPKVRAKRRHAELVAKGKDISFKQVLKETKERDKRDATKGGLVRTKDAVLIDTTKLTVDQTVERMLEYILDGN